MYGYIYKTTNLLNGKIYIGQHKSENYDSSYYGSGKLIKRSIEKYGIENFSNTVLCFCDSKEELDKAEKQLIRQYDSRNPKIGYNISFGGDGGDTFTGLPAEEKQIRIENLKTNSYFANLTQEQDKVMRSKSWETRRKNGNDKFSEESKKKMSASHKGKKPTEEQIQKMLKTKGKYHHTEETKQKIRNSNKGKKKNLTKEQREKLSERAKKLTGENNPFYGKHHSEKTKKIIGEKCGDNVKDTIWVHNEFHSYRIKKEELDKYIKTLNCKLGRKKWKNVKEFSNKI